MTENEKNNKIETGKTSHYSCDQFEINTDQKAVEDFIKSKSQGSWSKETREDYFGLEKDEKIVIAAVDSEGKQYKYLLTWKSEKIRRGYTVDIPDGATVVVSGAGEDAKVVSITLGVDPETKKPQKLEIEYKSSTLANKGTLTTDDMNVMINKGVDLEQAMQENGNTQVSEVPYGSMGKAFGLGVGIVGGGAWASMFVKNKIASGTSSVIKLLTHTDNNFIYRNLDNPVLRTVLSSAETHMRMDWVVRQVSNGVGHTLNLSGRALTLNYVKENPIGNFFLDNTYYINNSNRLGGLYENVANSFRQQAIGAVAPEKVAHFTDIQEDIISKTQDLIRAKGNPVLAPKAEALAKEIEVLKTEATQYYHEVIGESVQNQTITEEALSLQSKAGKMQGIADKKYGIANRLEARQPKGKGYSGGKGSGGAAEGGTGGGGGGSKPPVEPVNGTPAGGEPVVDVVPENVTPAINNSDDALNIMQQGNTVAKETNSAASTIGNSGDDAITIMQNAQVTDESAALLRQTNAAKNLSGTTTVVEPVAVVEPVTPTYSGAASITQEGGLSSAGVGDNVDDLLNNLERTFKETPTNLARSLDDGNNVLVDVLEEIPQGPEIKLFDTGTSAAETTLTNSSQAIQNTSNVRLPASSGPVPEVNIANPAVAIVDDASNALASISNTSSTALNTTSGFTQTTSTAGNVSVSYTSTSTAVGAEANAGRIVTSSVDDITSTFGATSSTSNTATIGGNLANGPIDDMANGIINGGGTGTGGGGGAGGAGNIGSGGGGAAAGAAGETWGQAFSWSMKVIGVAGYVAAPIFAGYSAKQEYDATTDLIEKPKVGWSGVISTGMTGVVATGGLGSIAATGFLGAGAAGLTAFAGANFWNPVGWVAGAYLLVDGVTYIATGRGISQRVGDAIAGRDDYETRVEQQKQLQMQAEHAAYVKKFDAEHNVVIDPNHLPKDGKYVSHDTIWEIQMIINAHLPKEDLAVLATDGKALATDGKLGPETVNALLKMGFGTTVADLLGLDHTGSSEKMEEITRMAEEKNHDYFKALTNTGHLKSRVVRDISDEIIVDLSKNLENGKLSLSKKHPGADIDLINILEKAKLGLVEKYHGKDAEMAKNLEEGKFIMKQMQNSNVQVAAESTARPKAPAVAPVLIEPKGDISHFFKH